METETNSSYLTEPAGSEVTAREAGEWQHNCKGAGRALLIPANECCDRCGMEPPGQHYFDRLEAWLGWGQPSEPTAGVSDAAARAQGAS